MKKNTIKTALFIALLSMGGYSVNAQNKELKVGTNPTIKQPSAVLEVESTNKGVLMPRVTLTSITDAATIAMPANALTVFNTATAGTAPNDVTPGYYYWSTAESKWIRLLNQNDITEPWQIQGTATRATSNAENIYQSGSVAIGKNAVQAGAALDVEGAVRGGSEHLGTVGENSVAFGFRNISSNFYTSIGGGANNIASGTSAVISGGDDNIASGGTAVVSGGSNNTASELGATVSGGQVNTASSQEATVSGGHQNVASGKYSTVSGGLENYARSFGEWAGGLRTTDYTPYNAVNYDNRDRLFNIGNGIGVGRDAFTILKNGKTGIGFNNFETTTFGELLQVNGNARFATLPSETGNIATDRVVVADADGVLKTVASDNLAVEPWQVEGTTDKATDNTQNIYQMGNVGIGTATPEGRLHVYANSLATTPIFEKETTNVPAPNFGLGIVSVRHLANLTAASLAGYTGHGSWVGGGVTLGQNYSFKSGTDAQIDIAGISAGLVDYDNKKGQLNFFVNSGISGFKSAPLSGLNPPAMVLSTDGYLGLGTATASSSATYFPPTNKLHVKTTGIENPVRFENLQASITPGTDKIVVADATGILKTVTAAAIATPQTNTTLSIAAGQLVYANENGNNPNVSLISADADNALIAGTDGRLFAPTVENIYTADGLLTSTRTLDINNHQLTFSGTEQQTFWSADGSMNQSGSDGRASLSMYGGNDSNLFIQQFENSNAQITTGGNSTGLYLGTADTNVSAPIIFSTSVGGGANGTEKMRITGEGNIGIDQNIPTERLDIGTGNVRIRGINANAGTGSDKIVVADANGILKTIAAPTTAAIRTVAANYNAVATDETILVNAAGGTVTVTLPAVPTAGKKYNVKKIDATANTVNVSGNGHNIDGNATVSGTLPYQGWVMQYDGANWFIISRI